MPILKIYDRAHEFRVEIHGKFAGSCVADVANAWRAALLETPSRTYAIDISNMVGYDSAGRKLLSEMCQHGMQIAARTPAALMFLAEISRPPRQGVSGGNGKPKLRKAAEPAAKKREPASAPSEVLETQS